MQFLRTLFWVVIAVFVAIFASRNWRDVTVDLWGPLQVDIKLPVLMLLLFVAGWLPTWLVMRGKLWRLSRRLVLADRPVPPPPAVSADDAEEPA